MTEAWVDLDGVAETDLPPHASDGRRGDRVSFVEGGLLHVRDGRATFARWSDVLGVLEHEGRAYVLVPRRPPSPPWLEIDRAMLGPSGGDEAALGRFLERVRAGGGSAGYRDAVRKHRQGLSRKALKAKVLSREPVPGAMEVPSTIVLGRSYPGLGPVQALTVMGGLFVGYVAAVAGMVAVETGAHNLAPLASLFMWLAPIAGVAIGAVGAREIGRVWRAQKDLTFPRQRVLVLAPDGCIAGFSTGVRTLNWARVGGFVAARVEPSYDLGVRVLDPEGATIGELDGGFLDAPVGLVVAVAEAYRESAAGE